MKTFYGVLFLILGTFQTLGAQETSWWKEFRNQFEMTVPGRSLKITQPSDEDLRWRQVLLKKLKVNSQFIEKGGGTATYLLTDQVCVCRLNVYVSSRDRNRLVAMYMPFDGYLIDLKKKKVSAFNPGGGIGWQDQNKCFQTVRSLEAMKEVEREAIKDRELSGSYPDFGWKEIVYIPVNEGGPLAGLGVFHLRISPKHPYQLTDDDKQVMGSWQDPDDNMYLLTQDLCEMKCPVYVDQNDPKRLVIPAGSQMGLFWVGLKEKQVGMVIPGEFHFSPDGLMVVSIVSPHERAQSGSKDDFYDTVGPDNFRFSKKKIFWQEGSPFDY